MPRKPVRRVRSFLREAFRSHGRFFTSVLGASQDRRHTLITMMLEAGSGCSPWAIPGVGRRRAFALALVAVALHACSLFAPGDAELFGGSPPRHEQGGVAGHTQGGVAGGLDAGASGSLNGGRPNGGSGGTNGGAGLGATGATGHGGEPSAGVAGTTGAGATDAGGSSGAGTAGATGIGGEAGEDGGNAGDGGGDAGGGGSMRPSPPVSDGLALWLRADLGVIHVDNVVTDWLDQSGAGADARQRNAAASPSLLDEFRNGQPAIAFDGVDDYLQLGSGFEDFDAGVSVFMVAEALSTEVCSGLIELSNGPEAEDISLHRDSAAGLVFEVWETWVPCSEGFPDHVPLFVGGVQGTDGTMVTYVNGAACDFKEGVLLPEHTIRSANFIARSNYESCSARFAGNIAEVLLYTRAVRSEERVTIENYLRERYGL
jgi:hypothetical protein